jgi:Protein of unknown function (DUF3100)
MKSKEKLKVIIIGALIVIASELIGTIRIGIGSTNVTFLPMIWGTFIGMFLGTKKLHIVNEEEMAIARNMIMPGTLMLIALLSFSIGQNIDTILKSGVILILQELGNLATIIFALPIAIFLGLKRQSIGAAFTLPREGGLAVISDKYGLDSEEGKGVMGVYVIGTIIGSVFYSIFAAFCANYLNLHPYALAMAAGMGSFSMMAGVTGTLVEMFPNMQDSILAFSGGSAVLTTLDGVWLNVFVALPLANKLYDVMTRKKLRKIGEVNERI